MPRKTKITTVSMDAVLKSAGFQDVIKLLEAEHPARKGLDHNATIEKRALYQIQTQEYEAVLTKLRGMATAAQAKTIESTYEQPTDK